MSTQAQPLAAAPPPAAQTFDPIGELRKRYPGIASEPDDKVYQHLSDPNNFRSAFPEYAHLDDETITRNMAGHAPTEARRQGIATPFPAAAAMVPQVKTEFEKQRTEGPRGLWDAIKSSVSTDDSLVSDIPGFSAAAGLFNAAASAPRHATEAWKESGSANGSRFDSTAKIGNAVASVLAPVIGVNQESMRARAEHADTSGILGEAAVPAAMAVTPLAGEALKPIAKPIGRAISRVADSGLVKAVTEIPKKLAEPLGVGVPGERMVKQGIAPHAKQLGFDNALKTLGNDIVEYHKDSPIKTVKDLDEALPKIKEGIEEKEFKPTMERHAKEELVPERAARAKQAVIDSVSPFEEEFEPGTEKSIGEFAEKVGKVRTIGDLIGGPRGGLLGYINAKLESYFQKYPSARRSDLMKNPDTAAWEAARRSLREETLSQLEEGGESGIREARQRWGAAEELSRGTERRINQGDRLKPVGLGKTLGLAMAPKTLGASYILGAIGDFLNKPDTLVGRGVEKMSAAKAREPLNVTPKTPAPKALPASEARKVVSGPGGPPPQVESQFRTEPTGRVEGPTTLGTRGKGGAPAPKLLPAPKEGTPPPAVPLKSRVEGTGRAPADATALGTRGEGGTVGGRKLLPAPAPEPTPAKPSPIMKPKAGPLPETATPLVRETAQAPKVPYTPQELEEAEGLVKQTRDVLASGDRPGRYYSENEKGDYNKDQSSARGVTAGGHWFGVKSIRGDLPWIGETKYTLSQIERGMREGGNTALRNEIINSAADFVRREKENPKYAFRTHDAGNHEVNLESHAHATGSRAEAESFVEGREAVEGKPQTISRINLRKFAPEDYEVADGPNGNKWYKFKRQLAKEDYE